MELFKLLGTIAVENSDANKAIDDTTDKAEGAKGKLGKAFSKIGQGAAAVGKTIGVGLAAGATAMTGLAVKALNLGGDLEQNLGGSEAVFKNFAGKMQNIGKTAFKDMGLSQSDFLATANKMGALFQGSGFGIEESANLSSKAMQRAADVASVMGISTQDAMEAISGAAKGNFEMMDNLGVAMNDTAIQNYAMSKGINKSTMQMTQQEKVGLAMQMFLEKTTYAAGNYSKENDTLAGSLGTAKAALTNFLDGSGSVDDLVDSLLNATDVILKNVNELLPRLVTGVSDLINKLIPKIPTILKALLPSVINGAVMILQGVVNALPAIINVLMGALPSLISGVQKIFEAIIDALPTIIQSLISLLPALIPQLVTGLTSILVLLMEKLPEMISPILKMLPSLIPQIINGIVSILVLLMQRLPEMINPIIEKLPDIIISIINGLMNNLPALINGLIQLTIGIVRALPQIILALIQALPTIISSIVKGLFKALPQLIAGIIQIVGEIGKAIWDTLTGIINKVKTMFKNGFNEVKETVTNIFDKIKNAITNPIDKAKETVKSIIDKIKGFLNFKWEFPKLKLPHFTVSGSMNPLKWIEEGVPKLAVEWYAKGAVLKQPTAFGINSNTGKAMIGGEAGDEAVAPIDTLLGYVKQAVAGENGKIEYLLQRLFDLLAEYLPNLPNYKLVLDTGTLVGEMAPDIDTELGKIYKEKERGSR